MTRLSGVLAVLALLTVACQPGAPTNTCGADSCSGCCDAAGVCQVVDSPQACGQSGFACVACAAGDICKLGTCVPSVATCTPTTCIAEQKNCGTLLDGCGGQLGCGTCETPGESCGGTGHANVCGVGTCVPGTCSAGGKNCGQLSDGCGSLLSCGTCTVAGESCGGAGAANVCGTPSCVAKTCGELGKNCGVVSDGCTGQNDCGTCGVAGDTCGGGGVTNVCGKGACVPKTCQQLGATCGMISDGCGNTIACGTCTGFATCGGGGVANACGATCPSTCPTGFSCTAGVCAGGNLQGLTFDIPVPALGPGDAQRNQPGGDLLLQQHLRREARLRPPHRHPLQHHALLDLHDGQRRLDLLRPALPGRV